MRKIALFSHKGGVGKSTISVQLSDGLAREGNKVLLLDLDAQRQCAMYLGVKSEIEYTFYDLIDDRYPKPLTDCVFPARENLDLMSNENYESIEKDIIKYPRVDFFLEDYLEDIEKLDYDYLIVDCSPTPSAVNNAVLYYVDELIVPILLEGGSVQGISDLHDKLNMLRLQTSMIKLIVPNKFDKRTNMHKEYLGKLKEYFPNKLIDPIYSRIKISEATSKGKTVYEYGQEKHFNHLIRRVKTNE